MKIDWEEAKYIGIDLDCNYTKQDVILLMKGYVKRALKKFKHLQPTRHHYGPTKYKLLEYGQKIQYTTVDTSPELTETQKNFIQQVCVKFLYNGRSVNATQLHSLNELSIKATEATNTNITYSVPKFHRK